MRVLVVDDEATMRVVLRIKLETMGWLVDEARSGGEALARWEEVPPDAIVLDHRMPEETGLEVAKRLRDEGYDRTILLYSAYFTAELETEAQAAGVVTVAKTQFSDLIQHLQQTAAGTGSEGTDA